MTIKLLQSGTDEYRKRMAEIKQAQLEESTAFHKANPDHDRQKDADLRRLLAEAQNCPAQIATEKLAADVCQQIKDLRLKIAAVHSEPFIGASQLIDVGDSALRSE